MRLPGPRPEQLAKAQAPVCVAVTGCTGAPSLWESLRALGREWTAKLIEAASERLRIAPC